MLAIHPILFPATYVLASLAEAAFPSQALPRVARWRMKGLVFFALGGVVNAALPVLWVERARSARLANLEGLGVIGGALVTLLVLDFLGYVWHRARHRVPLLWRLLHQMHHSAERLDVPGAFYGHPLDMLSVTLLTSFGGALLGVRPEAAALAGYAGFVLSVLQHANIATPHWLGYVVQRPESHSVHHARGVHAYNYANLPIFDMLFGTFKNPLRRAPQAGFWDGASSRLWDLLRGVDVNAKAAPRDASIPT